MNTRRLEDALRKIPSHDLAAVCRTACVLPSEYLLESGMDIVGIIAAEIIKQRGDKPCLPGS